MGAGDEAHQGQRSHKHLHLVQKETYPYIITWTYDSPSHCENIDRLSHQEDKISTAQAILKISTDQAILKISTDPNILKISTGQATLKISTAQAIMKLLTAQPICCLSPDCYLPAVLHCNDYVVKFIILSYLNLSCGVPLYKHNAISDMKCKNTFLNNCVTTIPRRIVSII